MARKRDRAFALFFAALFLLTSSALTIVIILQASQGSNKPNTAQTPEVKPVDPAKQLQGKPLAGFTPVPKIDGLQSIDTSPGSGAEVKPGDTVTVDYTGAVAATG